MDDAAMERAGMAALAAGRCDAGGVRAVRRLGEPAQSHDDQCGEAATAQPPIGIHRVTRHPMLWSFGMGGGALIGNGVPAAIVFFGGFLVTALAGIPSIDAKLARRDPAQWQTLSADTSIVPFAAIAQDATGSCRVRSDGSRH